VRRLHGIRTYTVSPWFVGRSAEIAFKKAKVITQHADEATNHR
jgi:hypothetical protein